MNHSHDPLVDHIAKAMRGDPPPAEILRDANAIIRAGQGAKLFEAIMELERSNGREGHEVVPNVMRHLERMMPESPAVGAYLMGRLYAYAWKTTDHSVYDGIEIWMREATSPEAADALQLLSSEPIRRALKKVCLEWAEMIRAKST